MENNERGHERQVFLDNLRSEFLRLPDRKDWKDHENNHILISIKFFYELMERRDDFTHELMEKEIQEVFMDFLEKIEKFSNSTEEEEELISRLAKLLLETGLSSFRRNLSFKEDGLLDRMLADESELPFSVSGE